MALAEIEPAIARVDSQPAVASSADEPLAERVLLAIIAALVAVLVPGEAERLIDTPLNLGGPRLRLRRQRPGRARLLDNAWVVSTAPWRPRADHSR